MVIYSWTVIGYNNLVMKICSGWSTCQTISEWPNVTSDFKTNNELRESEARYIFTSSWDESSVSYVLFVIDLSVTIVTSMLMCVSYFVVPPQPLPPVNKSRSFESVVREDYTFVILPFYIWKKVKLWVKTFTFM